jgi:hypothetical protein
VKQVITVQRTETITVEVQVLQRLSPKAQAEWANSGGIGGIGLPQAGVLQVHTTTDWAPVGLGGKKKARGR